MILRCTFNLFGVYRKNTMANSEAKSALCPTCNRPAIRIFTKGDSDFPLLNQSTLTGSEKKIGTCEKGHFFNIPENT
jgi:hypothetical protein